MRGSRVVAIVAERQSEFEVVIDVYRYEPRDTPQNRINLDRYRVWETLPANLDYVNVVNSGQCQYAQIH